MIRVSPLQILGTPEQTDQTITLANGHTGRVMTDGSVLDLTDGAFFAPEAGNEEDAELTAIRAQFDQRNGITPSHRLIIPAHVASGVPFDFASHRA